MPRNGAGTYSLTAGNPVVTGTTISSSWANTTLSDIGTALTASIANDGQTPVLANLPMGGFKHTGVAVAAALTDYARTDQAQNSAFQWLSSVSGADTITASASPVPSAYAAGQTFRFVSAGANTGAATLNVSSLGAKSITKNGTTALVANDIPSGAVVEVTYDGTQFQLVALPKALSSGAFTTVGTAASLNVGTSANNVVQLDGSAKLPAVDGSQLTNLPSSVLRSYLAGLTLSTAGSSATMSIAAGQATSDDQATSMTLGSAISKTTSAWAVGTGNGGLDTGAIANSTWYHFYLIERTDTGVVDVLFSLSASSPTMPTNYTKKRRIGSGKTNGSAQWVSFKQTGDYFRLAASVLDVNTTNPGTASVTATLASVPSGVKVKALINAEWRGGTSANVTVYVRDLDANDEAPTNIAGASPSVPGGSFTSQSGGGAAYLEVMTNTSSQIGYRVTASGASDIMGIATLGWIDTRGREA